MLRKILFSLLNLFAFTEVLAASEGPVCKKCEIIREENAKKGPPEYEYYEDYLKAHPEALEKPAATEKN